MESFSYVDIYATKGIEYLIVLGFLIGLVIFWKVLTALKAGQAEGSGAVETELGLYWFKVPQDRFFHTGHTWLKVEDGGLINVGLDDFAQKLAGQATEFNLPEKGSTLTQGDVGWTLNIDSHLIPVLSPVSGEVVSVNDEILRFPAAVNQDCYGKGWILKIKSPSLMRDLRNLIKGSLAVKWMEESVEKLFSRRSEYDLGTVLADGGIPVDGIAKSIDKENWEEILKEFFLTKFD